MCGGMHDTLVCRSNKVLDFLLQRAVRLRVHHVGLLQLLLQRLDLDSTLLDSWSIGRRVDLCEKVSNKVTILR